MLEYTLSVLSKNTYRASNSLAYARAAGRICPTRLWRNCSTMPTRLPSARQHWVARPWVRCEWLPKLRAWRTIRKTQWGAKRACKLWPSGMRAWQPRRARRLMKPTNSAMPVRQICSRARHAAWTRRSGFWKRTCKLNRIARSAPLADWRRLTGLFTHNAKLLTDPPLSHDVLECSRPATRSRSTAAAQ